MFWPLTTKATRRAWLKTMGVRVTRWADDVLRPGHGHGLDNVNGRFSHEEMKPQIAQISQIEKDAHARR